MSFISLLQRLCRGLAPQWLHQAVYCICIFTYICIYICWRHQTWTVLAASRHQVASFPTESALVWTHAAHETSLQPCDAGHPTPAAVCSNYVASHAGSGPVVVCSWLLGTVSRQCGTLQRGSPSCPVLHAQADMQNSISHGGGCCNSVRLLLCKRRRRWLPLEVSLTPSCVCESPGQTPPCSSKQMTKAWVCFVVGSQAEAVRRSSKHQRQGCLCAVRHLWLPTGNHTGAGCCSRGAGGRAGLRPADAGTAALT